MAVIDLETLQITIAANTASLERVTPAIRKVTASVTKMQKTVTASMEKVSSSFIKTASAEEKLTASTRKAEAAMMRKRVALIRAETAVENLQSRIHRLNAATKEEQAIVTRLGRRANVAYNIYTDAVRRAAGSTTKLSLANARLRKDLAGISRVVGRQNFKKAETRHNAFARAMNNLTSASVLAVGPLSGVGARIAALGAIVNRANIRMAAMVIAVSGLAIGVGALAFGAVKASLAMEKINAGLRVATGSTAAAKREFEFISMVAEDLGQDLTTVSLQYSKLAGAVRGTSITLKDARDIFKGVSLASTALQLSGDETAGMFRALQQIASKGTVQMEELRGQFGERMPGAMALAADAMGITVKELSKITGEAKLTAEVFLPKLAAQLIKTFGGPAEKAAQSLRSEINRFKNSLFLFASTFDDVFQISEKFRKSIKVMNSVITSITANMKGLDAILQGVIASLVTFIALKVAASLIATSLAATGAAIGFEALGFAIGVATMKIKLFLASNPVGWLILLGSVLVGSIVAYEKYGNAIDNAKESVDKLTRSYADLLKAKVSDRAENIKAIISAEEVLLAQQKIDLETKGVDVLTGEKFVTIYNRISKAIEGTESRIKGYRHELSKLAVTSKEQRDEIDRLISADAALIGMTEDATKGLSDQQIALAALAEAFAFGAISLTKYRTELRKVIAFFGDFNDVVDESMKGEIVITPKFDLVEFDSSFKLWRDRMDLIRDGVEGTEPGTKEFRIKLALNVQAIEDIEKTEPLHIPDVLVDDPDRKIRQDILKDIEAQSKAFENAQSNAQKYADTISSTAVATLAAGGTIREAIQNIVRNLIAMAAQAWLNFLLMRAMGFPVGAPNFGVAPPAAAVNPGALGSGASVGVSRAAGGPLQAGQLALVGENGPELFRPTQSGTVIPNGSSMGGNTIIIHAEGAEAGVEERILSAMQNFEERAVSRSVNTVLTLRQRGQI